MDARSLLTNAAEREKFEAQYRLYPREIRSVGLDADKTDGDDKREDLARRVSLRFDSIRRRGGFRCMVVSARLDDGVTWAATAAVGGIAAGKQGPKVIMVDGSPRAGAQTRLVAMFGSAGPVARAAYDNGLIASVGLVSWLRWLIIGGGLALIALIEYLVGTVGGFVPFVAVAILFVLAGLLYALERGLHALKLNPKRARMDDVAKGLCNQTGEPGYPGFVAACAERFARFSGERVVVIDGVNTLDAPTLDVVIYYLTEQASADRNELWILFDTSGTRASSKLYQELERRRLATRTSAASASYGLENTTHYVLLALSDNQCAELARSLGRPNWHSNRVKALVRGSTDRVKKAMEAAELRADDGPDVSIRYASFELLYLLSITAAHGTNYAWSDSELVKVLPTGKNLRSVVRQAVLQTRGRSPSSMRDLLKELGNAFGGLISMTPEAHGNGALRVDVEVADHLEAEHARYRLPPPSLAHLFWAMYWYDTRGPHSQPTHSTQRHADPVFIEKVKIHLLKIGDDPRALRGYLGDDTERIAEALFDIVLDTVHDCLRLCLITGGESAYGISDVSRLIEFATALAGDTPGRSRVERLRLAAAEAYILLGDGHALDPLYQLDETLSTDGEAAKSSSLAESAVSFFIQTISNPLARTAFEPRHEPGLGMATLLRYAALRGDWVTLSVQMLTAGGGVSKLSYAADRAYDNAVAVAAQALATAQHAAAQTARGANRWDASEYLSLVQAIWSAAWAGSPYRSGARAGGEPDGSRASQIIDVLQKAWRVGADLRTKRFSKGYSELDLVVDALTVEVLTTTAAATMFVRETWQVHDHADRSRLNNLLAQAREEFQSRQGHADSPTDDMIAALQRNLRLLEVTWRRFGYRILADDLAIRAAQFELVRPRRVISVARSLVDQLAADYLHRLLANIALADHAYLAERSDQLAAEHGVYAAETSIRGTFGEELAGQLCLGAIGLAYPYNTNLDHLVSFLMAASDANADMTRLDAHLAALSDDLAAKAAIWLYDIAKPVSAGPDLINAIHRRRSTIVDEDAASDIDDILYIYWYESAANLERPSVDDVIARWHDRQDRALYPFMLVKVMTLANPPLEGTLREHIFSTLDRSESYRPSNSAWLLARQTIDATNTDSEALQDKTSDARRAIAVLDREYLYFRHRLGVDEHLSVLWLMILAAEGDRQLDLENRYRDARTVRDETYARRLQQQLLQRYGFALNILDCINMFERFGMPFAGTPPQVTPGNLRAYTPQVLVSGESGPAVSREFVDYGNALFTTRTELNEHEANRIRRDFDTAARRQTLDFYGLLTTIETVPETLRKVLQRHRTQVEARLAEWSQASASL